ncbi:alpha-L-rhamnosidase-like protein [Paenibacillus prosopidis]|uniref:Alpha-L-rhamnosidase-like protein n=1 Tax=Paenibacillus prosopidis TaxID=630520 RepID=A0A368VR61_9BACL|nr:alpha-L-rhamnosidase-like protein [Paenibacillus prosopidis]
MKITRLKTNRISNPLGFELGTPRLSYVATDTTAIKQIAAQIQVSLDETITRVVFDSGKSEQIDSLAYELPIPLTPKTRYYWRVKVWADNGDEAISDIAWFETAKLQEAWNADWITPNLDKTIHPAISTEFSLSKAVKSARAYVCGLGLYEMEINGGKAGEE